MTLDSLTALYLEGRLDQSQLEQLEALLDADPTARARFRQLCNLDTALNDWAPIQTAQSAWAEAGESARSAQKRNRWIAWPAAAAIALGGLLTGFLSGSLVSARALSPKEARSVPLPLVNGNFDAAQPPSTDGPPKEFAQWGGDFSRVTGEDQGIRPPNGRRMLRFLRADNAQSPKTKGQAASELWQTIDLRPLREQLGNKPAHLELSALFNSTPIPKGRHFAFGVSAYAFQSDSADGAQLWSRHRDAALASGGKIELSDSDPATWQRITTQILVPPDATVLLVTARVGSADRLPPGSPVVEFPGQYMANVSLRLLP
jgi:hypothetical protein